MRTLLTTKGRVTMAVIAAAVSLGAVQPASAHDDDGWRHHDRYERWHEHRHEHWREHWRDDRRGPPTPAYMLPRGLIYVPPPVAYAPPPPYPQAGIGVFIPLR